MNIRPPHSIKLLPEFLIDQIKAGEIIERPAGLLKEVIENSLDAKATKIEIHLVDNGLKQITIRDDGMGIPFQDLPYAFCRHATSKIEKFQDLYLLNSFGFRGEALASIAAISHVTCLSRCRNLQGGQITLEGGLAEEPIEQKDLPYGTWLTIRNLFYNTPVRLNFIKSQNAEKNALVRVLNSFLISHPKVEFHLKWDNEEKNIFRPSDRFQRFTQALSHNRWAKNEFSFVEKHYENYRLNGFYGQLAKKSGQRKNQYLFVNRRPIQDKALHRIISTALESEWPLGCSAPYLFELELPTDEVDVNVHPNKIEVKFSAPSIVHSLFYSTLKTKARGSHSHDEQIEGAVGTKESQRGPQMALKPSPDLKKSHFQSYEQREMIVTQLSLSVGPRYQVLSQKDGLPLVVDILSLIRFHLNSISDLLATQKRIPLMVGIPFRGQQIAEEIQCLSNWESRNFEFERLANDLIILRSYPQGLALLPLRATIFHFIGREKEFEQEVTDDSPSTNSLHEMITKYSLEQLRENKTLTVLTPQDLTNLFQ